MKLKKNDIVVCTITVRHQNTKHKFKDYKLPNIVYKHHIDKEIDSETIKEEKIFYDKKSQLSKLKITNPVQIIKMDNVKTLGLK